MIALNIDTHAHGFPPEWVERLLELTEAERGGIPGGNAVRLLIL
jgi:hypothetical protein